MKRKDIRGYKSARNFLLQKYPWRFQQRIEDFGINTSFGKGGVIRDDYADIARYDDRDGIQKRGKAKYNVKERYKKTC